MRVDPEHAAGAVAAAEPPERADRHRVVAAENERQQPVLAACVTRPATRSHCALIGRGSAHARSPTSARLRDGRLDVSPVEDLAPSSSMPRREPRVADRGRPHVDAAAAGAQVESRADHGDRRFSSADSQSGKLPLSEHGGRRDSGIRSCLRTMTERFLESLSAADRPSTELRVVGPAADGLEAIEQADELEPDAVVIDLHMPLSTASPRSRGCGTTIRASA